MKTLQMLVFAAVVGCSGVIARGQVLVLNGSVTQVAGIFGSDFAVGDPVVLSLDFYHAAEFGDLSGDIWGGTHPGEAMYVVGASLTIGGEALPIVSLPSSYVNFAASLVNQPMLEGLQGNVNWAAGSPQETLGVSQHLTGTGDLLNDVVNFPADIPISEFSDRAGSYTRWDFRSGDTVVDGRIEWDISSYSGSVSITPRPLPAIPEPAVYGWVAVLGLVGMAVRRQWRGTDLRNRAVDSSGAHP